MSSSEPAVSPAPAPEAEVPTNLDPNAGFVKTPDVVRDRLTEYAAAKAALESGQEFKISGELRNADKPAQPARPAQVAPEPEAEPVAEVEPEEAPASESAEPESQETPAAPEQPKTEPAPAAEKPAEPEGLPPLPEGINLYRLSDADAFEKELVAKAKQHTARLEFEEAEALLSKVEQIQEARPIIAQYEAAENQAWNRADQIVVDLYPDAAKPGTPFASRLEELYGQWLSTEDPRGKGPQGIVRCAAAVAAEFGVNPKSSKPVEAPQKPAEATPKPLPAAQRQSSIQRGVASPSPVAALQSATTQPTSAPSQPDWVRSLKEDRSLENYESIKEKVLAGIAA